MEVQNESCFSRKADGIAFLVSKTGEFITGTETVAKTWPEVKMLISNIASAGHLQGLVDIKYDLTWLFAIREDCLQDDITSLIGKCQEVGCESFNFAANIESSEDVLSILNELDHSSLDVEIFTVS